MDKKNEKMAVDDLFYASVLGFAGVKFLIENYNESDWFGFAVCGFFTLISGVWISARIYQLFFSKE